jgi:rod shape-determining protein MreD
MKPYLLIAFALFVAFLGQTVLLRYFPFIFPYLDLFLVVVVYYSLKENPVRATCIGTSAGLIQDVFSSGILGFNSFAKTLIAFILSSINARVMLQHPATRVVILILATLLNGLLLRGLSLFFGIKYIPQIFPDIFYQAAVNGIVGIIIISLLFFYNQKMQKR